MPRPKKFRSDGQYLHYISLREALEEVKTLDIPKHAKTALKALVKMHARVLIGDENYLTRDTFSLLKERVTQL